MLNILTFEKLLLRKTDVLKNSIFKVKKVHFQVDFWGAPTDADIIEFSNLCCNLKIRGLKAKLCVAFLLFLF